MDVRTTLTGGFALLDAARSFIIMHHWSVIVDHVILKSPAAECSTSRMRRTGGGDR